MSRFFTMFGLCRATPEEGRRTLPGDEVIPHPIMRQTHAITIGVPPDQVWPWLVQMGCGRAGWYSYDLLDNGGRHSATTVNPAWQHLAIGDVMPAVPGSRDAFVVTDFTPGKMLLLGVPIVTAVRDARESAPASTHTSYPRTMVYVSEETPDHHTRLITRGRGGDVPSLPSSKARNLVGIKQRAGRQALVGSSSSEERRTAVLSREPRTLLDFRETGPKR